MTGTSSIRGQIRVPNNFASSVVAAADIPIGDSSRLLKMFVVRIEKRRKIHLSLAPPPILPSVNPLRWNFFFFGLSLFNCNGETSDKGSRRDVDV